MIIPQILVISTAKSPITVTSHLVFALIYDTYSKSNWFYMNQLENTTLNWLLMSPQYEVLKKKANRAFGILVIPN